VKRVKSTTERRGCHRLADDTKIAMSFGFSVLFASRALDLSSSGPKKQEADHGKWGVPRVVCVCVCVSAPRL